MKRTLKLRRLNQKKEDEKLKEYEKLQRRSFNLKRVVFFLILFIGGLIAVVVVDTASIGNSTVKNIVKDSFLALAAVGMIELLKDTLLSDENEIMMSRIFRRYLPNNIDRIRNSGISDYIQSLDYGEIEEKINNSHDVKIRILRMRFIEFSSIKDTIQKSLENNNTIVEIVLLSPYAEEIIKKRLRAENNNKNISEEDVATFQNDMKSVIKKIEKMRMEISDKNKVKLYFHNTPMPISLTGIDNEWLVSFFLLKKSNKNVMATPHLVVSGTDKSFQHYIKEHYKKQLEYSEEYPFDSTEEVRATFLKEVANK